MTDLAEQLIGEEEGRSAHVYQDSRQLWTIGVGCLVDPSVPSDGLCGAAIDAQFTHDSAVARHDASNLPNFAHFNDVRQAVLVSMCFELGSLADWPHLRAALAISDYNAVSDAMLDSDWARVQTPTRAKRAAWMMRSGIWLYHGSEIPDSEP